MTNNKFKPFPFQKVVKDSPSVDQNQDYNQDQDHYEELNSMDDSIGSSYNANNMNEEVDPKLVGNLDIKEEFTKPFGNTSSSSDTYRKDKKLKRKDQKIITFSVNTPEKSLPGQIYIMAKRLNVPIIAAFRHNLLEYEKLLDSIENEMSIKMKDIFDECVNILIISDIAKQEGINDMTKSQIEVLMQRASREDLSMFIRDLESRYIVLMVDRARKKIAKLQSFI